VRIDNCSVLSRRYWSFLGSYESRKSLTILYTLWAAMSGLIASCAACSAPVRFPGRGIVRQPAVRCKTCGTYRQNKRHGLETVSMKTASRLSPAPSVLTVLTRRPNIRGGRIVLFRQLRTIRETWLLQTCAQSAATKLTMTNERLRVWNQFSFVPSD
jgi:hypothetical protein